jgi:leader peptidase (prepilin peptidase) / N-methyltransferase
VIPDWFFILWFFAIGACVGSFINVVVYRLPRGEPIMHPRARSHCPHCQHALAWYDNIPVFGWIFLAGKCRYCRKPISPRYPIVEAAAGLLFAGFYVVIFLWHQGPFWAVYEDDLVRVIRMENIASAWPIFGLYLFSVGALLAASLIDAELVLIPAAIPLAMAAVAVIMHAIFDHPMMAGSLSTDAPELALATGGGLGLLISIALLRLGVFPLSFAQGEAALEIDKLHPKPDQEQPPDYTPGQIRAEIRKEMLFLLPPLALAGAAVWLNMQTGCFEPLAKIDWLSGLLGSILGGLAGGFTVWFTRIAGSYLFGKEAMGLGDIDLMFGVGAVVGPSAAVVAFLMAPFFGLPLALILYFFKSRRQLPYGPYLSMATVVVMLFYFPIYDYLRPGFIGLATILRSLI